MSKSKITAAKVPVTRPENPPLTKLGLLTNKNRKMRSFKLSQKTIEKLIYLTEKYKKVYFHGITKTDIVETALLHFMDLKVEQHLDLLSKYGERRTE